MKKLLSISGVVLVFTLMSWGQDQQSLGDAARDNQTKKARHVIDDDNIGSAITNSNGVQDASAKTQDSATGDSKESAADPVPDAKENDSAKHKLEVLKEKEASWSKTIDMANKHLETATGMARDMWERNLASAQQGLSDTRSKMPDAEAAAKEEESREQQQQAPTAANGEQTQQ